MDQLNYDIVMFKLQTGDEANKRYDFGGGGAGNPYVISQLSGIYSQFPDFLDSQQPIETKSDVGRLSSPRLEKVSTLLDNDPSRTP